MQKFPLNNQLRHGSILIRTLSDVYSFRCWTDNEEFIDKTAYPWLAYTKHVNTVRQNADGKVVSVTRFANEAAMAAAGETFALLDVVLDGTENYPANWYGKAHEVSYHLMNPRTLNFDETWIHHVTDPDTGFLHPTLFDVNNVATNAVGRIVDFQQVNKDGGVTEMVWGSYSSQYYRSFANA